MNSSYFEYGAIKLGRGGFDLPPILIGTIFYQGETIFDPKNSAIFDKEKAKKRISNHKALAEKYNLPELIEISAVAPEEMLNHLKFYLDNFAPPFVLGGTYDARIAGLEYLHERGINPESYVYNTITSLTNSKELELMRKFKIKSAVVLILGSETMNSSQKYAFLTNKDPVRNVSLIDGLKKEGIDKLWIDCGVVDLESLAHTIETQILISSTLNLPVGTAPNNFLFKYSSPRLNIKFQTRFRRASIMFLASWFSNFVFYGAIEDAKESFASAHQSLEFKKITTSKNIRLFDKI